MKLGQRFSKIESMAWPTVVLCVLLAALGLLHFNYGYAGKILDVLAGAGILALLAKGDMKRLWNLPALLVLGFVFYTMLTAFWAISGKFFLREYGKVFLALFFFLLVALRRRADRAFARRVMAVIAGVAAIYALLSVEAASTGFSLAVDSIGLLGRQALGYNGSRLYGIFGNSNIESSIYAIGVIFSVALLCGAEREKKVVRILCSVTLSFCAYGFLLVFSMVAVLCFAAAVVVYLIFAGTGRAAALLRMLSAAVPTLACALLASRMWTDGSAAPLLLMFVNAAVTVVLELLLSNRLTEVLANHQRLTFGVLIGVVALGAVYIVMGLMITGAYTFGDTINRGLRLEPGAHTVTVDADPGVTMGIYTQSRIQMMRSSASTRYAEGSPAEGEISFEVPEGTAFCYFHFSGEPGARLRSAVVDGTMELPLYYKLFPGFVANRIQNLTVSNSQYMRALYVEDAMKLVRLRPAFGHGVGAFETGISSVQDYHYETKYVHNHYIQTLLEGGVIGFVLFLGMMVSLALALWKRRKQPKDGEYYWIYPALCAEFVMNGLQMLWDVSMSMVVFTCFAYTLFGLITRVCAEPLPIPEPKGKGRDRRTAALRLGSMAFALFFAVSVCCNLIAGRLRDASHETYEGYLSNFALSARLDLYERNDSMLSYIVMVSNAELPSYREQADRYAARLSKVRSNTIPYYLVQYYLDTGQFEKAIDEAMLGATYSVSDAERWDGTIQLLNQSFVKTSIFSPLLRPGGDALLEKLLEFRAAFLRYNETALVPLTLNENSRTFFETVEALDACGGDRELMTAVLNGG